MPVWLTALFPVFTDLIKRIIPDPKAQQEAQAKMQELLNEAQEAAYKAQMSENENKKDIMVSEMTQTNWAGNWRAYLMIICIAIVGYNWIVVSFLNAFLGPLGFPITPVAVPTELWTLVTVGLGGYIGKETVQNYAQAKVDKATVESDARLFNVIKSIKGRPLTQQEVDEINNAK